MTIKITGTGTFSVIGSEAPAIGKKYLLQDADDPTLKQNNLFHALLMEYFSSGLCSRQYKDFKEFRDLIKRDLGAGFEFYVYADESGNIVKTKTYSDIPVEVRKTRSRILGKLKSWSDYTKKQRTETIENLLAERMTAGATTRKLDEILRGAQSD